jgi:hypothetical protein
MDFLGAIKKPPVGGWLAVAPNGVYQVFSDGRVRPLATLNRLFVADLNQAVLLQMLTMLAAPHDHLARGHGLVWLDVAHDHRPGNPRAFVFLSGDELERHGVLDVSLSHFALIALTWTMVFQCM